MRVERKDVRVSMNRVCVGFWGRVQVQSVRMTPMFTGPVKLVNSPPRMSAQKAVGRGIGGTVSRSHVYDQPSFPIGMNSLHSEETRRDQLEGRTSTRTLPPPPPRHNVYPPYRPPIDNPLRPAHTRLVNSLASLDWFRRLCINLHQHITMAAANGSLRQRHPPNGNLPEALSDGNTLAGKNDAALKSDREAQPQANTFRLVICVGGIYLSLYVCLSFVGFIYQQLPLSPITSRDNPPIFCSKLIMNHLIVPLHEQSLGPCLNLSSPLPSLSTLLPCPTQPLPPSRSRLHLRSPSLFFPPPLPHIPIQTNSLPSPVSPGASSKNASPPPTTAPQTIPKSSTTP